jgi:transposase InsO family protein
VRRHHLHPDWPRLPLSRGDHGLGEPGSAGLAAVQHYGNLVLRLGTGGSAGALWPPGDLQHFTGALMAAGVRISMDGRGRWMDNVFIERLWRSLKHEDIYLKGYADGREANSGIAAWFVFYNTRRPHQTLGDRTPMAVWREGTTGPLGNKAVDMMDNARALPTCPQRQQQAFAMVG